MLTSLMFSLVSDLVMDVSLLHFLMTSYCGNPLAWFISYLSDRVQHVKSEHILSDPVPVTKAAPQGSILGPTFLSMYINNMYMYINNIVH